MVSPSIWFFRFQCFNVVLNMLFRPILQRLNFVCKSELLSAEDWKIQFGNGFKMLSRFRITINSTFQQLNTTTLFFSDSIQQRLYSSTTQSHTTTTLSPFYDQLYFSTTQYNNSVLQRLNTTSTMLFNDSITCNDHSFPVWSTLLDNF